MEVSNAYKLILARFTPDKTRGGFFVSHAMHVLAAGTPALEYVHDAVAVRYHEVKPHIGVD
jgi:hypothetical protein